MTAPLDFGVADHTVVAWHYTPDHQLALRFADGDRHGALVIGWEHGRSPQILLMGHEEAVALSDEKAESGLTTERSS